MKQKRINRKLQELGYSIGLNDSDINRAKNTFTSMLGIAIAAAVVIFIGRFTVTRLEALGLYYTAVSIKDFGLLNRFF